MELSLTVQKSGITTSSNVSQPKGHRQLLTKVIRIAHRPVVFEVSGLIADTRCGIGQRTITAQTALGLLVFHTNSFFGRGIQPYQLLFWWGDTAIL